VNFQIVIEPRALRDIQKGIDFYDSKLSGLGKRFYLSVDTHIKSIANNPYYELRHKDYRAFPVKKFPYLILFYIDEKSLTVFVSAVFQTKQNTNKWPI